MGQRRSKVQLQRLSASRRAVLLKQVPNGGGDRATYLFADAGFRLAGFAGRSSNLEQRTSTLRSNVPREGLGFNIAVQSMRLRRGSAASLHRNTLPVVKLRRLAGVSEARACCRNPERSEGT